MRSSPSLENSDNIIGKLTLNQRITIQGEEGEWYLVRTQNAVQGYAHQDYIRILDEEELNMTKVWSKNPMLMWISSLLMQNNL